MKADADHRSTLLASFLILVLSVSAQARLQRPFPLPLETRAQREAFLSEANIVTDALADGRRSGRATLDDGTRKHDAFVDTRTEAIPRAGTTDSTWPPTNWIRSSDSTSFRHRSSAQSAGGRPP